MILILAFVAFSPFVAFDPGRERRRKPATPSQESYKRAGHGEGVSPQIPRGNAPLRAVVFDVDGVLVQSMERHHEAYQKAFALLGVHIEQHEVFANEGRRSREVIESLAQERGLGLSADRMDEMNRTKQQTFLGFGPLPLYPGVPELIEKLHGAGLRVSAVTGTNRQNVDNHLGDLTRRFDAIVTADDVKRTKPDPEPYLSALEKLGLRAEEAIVVENATLGIRAAKAAGIRVIGVASTLTPQELHEADVVVPKVADVWGVVEGLL